MKPTIPYIENKFAEFNLRMFAGRLPALPIKLSSAGGLLGQCVYRQRELPDGTRCYSCFELRISTRFDLPERVLEDIIIHEMIHYFILWSGLHDSSPHGEIFKALMNRINAVYGRNVGVRYNVGAGEQPQEREERKKCRVIAAIYFGSGKTGIKVLPRKADSIVRYHNAALSHPGVEEVGIYLHDDPFFGHYPTSSVLKMHSIDRRLLEEHLAGARRLRIAGNEITEG